MCSARPLAVITVWPFSACGRGKKQKRREGEKEEWSAGLRLGGKWAFSSVSQGVRWFFNTAMEPSRLVHSTFLTVGSLSVNSLTILSCICACLTFSMSSAVHQRGVCVIFFKFFFYVCPRSFLCCWTGVWRWAENTRAAQVSLFPFFNLPSCWTAKKTFNFLSCLLPSSLPPPRVCYRRYTWAAGILSYSKAKAEGSSAEWDKENCYFCAR